LRLEIWIIAAVVIGVGAIALINRFVRRRRAPDQGAPKDIYPLW